jgi:hypothetical protein
MESELTATLPKFRAGGVTEMIGWANAAVVVHKIKPKKSIFNFRIILSPQQK